MITTFLFYSYIRFVFISDLQAKFLAPCKENELCLPNLSYGELGLTSSTLPHDGVSQDPGDSSHLQGGPGPGCVAEHCM